VLFYGLRGLCVGSSNIRTDRSGFLRVRKGALINIHTNEGA
jgi:hypothetical protein